MNQQSSGQSGVTPIRDAAEMISLQQMPTNRHGFKFIGEHICVRPAWDGDISSLYLGPVSIAKAEEVFRAYKDDFPVANINVLARIQDRLEDVLESWIGKSIYIMGTTFANQGKEEHVVWFVISLVKKKGKKNQRAITVKTTSFTNGVESNARVLLLRE